MDRGVTGADPSPTTLNTSARSGRWRLDGWGALAIPVIVLLSVVIVAPLVGSVVESFTDPTPGFGNYARLFESSLYLKVLGNTFFTAAVVTVVTLLLAYPYAYLMTLATPGWRRLMVFVVLIPFWTSVLVRSFALVIAISDTGAINSVGQSLGVIDSPIPMIRTFGGVVFGMVQISIPFAVLPLYATMQGIDRGLLSAAESLGDRPSGAFWRIFFPLSLSGVAAAGLLTFVQAIGYYITPSLLGGPQNMMIGELVVQQISGVLNTGFAAALAVLLLVTTLVLLAIASKIVDLQKLLLGRAEA